MKVEPVVLENAVVRLDPLTEAWREPLRAAGADPGLWRYHPMNLHNRTFDACFDWLLAMAGTGEGLSFAVTERASGALCGSSSYLAVVPAQRRLEIGSTWYARPFQGGRVNPATKLALMAHAFETLGCIRVEFKLDARNARSWAAMRKLGATEEGIFRRHTIMPDGHQRDSVWFSVIAEEWPRVKAGLIGRLGGASV